MKAPVIAVAFAVGLGAGPSAYAPAGDAPVRDTVPTLESLQVGVVEFAPSDRNPAPAGNASAIIDAYLRIHAGVRSDATIVGLPGRGMLAVAQTSAEGIASAARRPSNSRTKLWR